MEENSTVSLWPGRKKFKNPDFYLLTYSGGPHGHQERGDARNSKEVQRANWIESGFSFGP
jgi:hypothetical protein